MPCLAKWCFVALAALSLNACGSNESSEVSSVGRQADGISVELVKASAVERDSTYSVRVVGASGAVASQAGEVYVYVTNGLEAPEFVGKAPLAADKAFSVEAILKAGQSIIVSLGSVSAVDPSATSVARAVLFDPTGSAGVLPLN